MLNGLAEKGYKRMVTRKATGWLAVEQGLKVLLTTLLAALLWGYAAHAEARYSFDLQELSTGQDLSMDLLTEGKPLIIHMWSPDCPHCQRHMPYLVGLYKKLDLDSVNFVTCAMGTDRRSASEYVRKKNLTFPVLYGEGGDISDSFSANGWPTTFVFAPGGKLVGTCDTQSSSYINEVLDLVDEALSY
jgi:thiol-disulfide isomerase/thioredoxin